MAKEYTQQYQPPSPSWPTAQFATHLLGKGTGIRMIQEMRGHASCKTTEIYTYGSKKPISGSQSVG